jgi:hypothetical protein
VRYRESVLARKGGSAMTAIALHRASARTN